MPTWQSRQSALNWRKSQASNASGECVEIASTGASVLVRDSYASSDTLLAFRPAQWSAFLARLRTDR
jgi:Domain of unknown function (DUF397)